MALLIYGSRIDCFVTTSVSPGASNSLFDCIRGDCSAVELHNFPGKRQICGPDSNPYTSHPDNVQLQSR